MVAEKPKEKPLEIGKKKSINVQMFNLLSVSDTFSATKRSVREKKKKKNRTVIEDSENEREREYLEM